MPADWSDGASNTATLMPCSTHPQQEMKRNQGQSRNSVPRELSRNALRLASRHARLPGAAHWVGF
jgi:hypothetical protein